uniref:Uncharacterized protein n=1 Tax=Anopheles funestus TaxID=62324 RepID=A0A182RTX2_ANOFN
MAKIRIELSPSGGVSWHTYVGAVPDFGVDVSIRGSVVVQGAAIRIEQRFAELTEHMNFELVSSYDKLTFLRDQFSFLAQNLTSIGTVFASALNTATRSNSSVSGTFELVIHSLAQLQTLQEGQIAGIVTEIYNLVGQPIRAQLQDSFSTIFASVQNLYGAVIQLIAAIQTSNDLATIDVAFVYLLNRAVYVLRANVLPLNYTISSTSRNIREVDAFLRRFSRSLQSGENMVINEVRRFQRQVGLLTNATLHVASCSRREVNDLGMSAAPLLQMLCDSSSEECPLQTAVESAVDLTTTEFDRVMAAVRRHFYHLATDSVFVEEIEDKYNDIYDLGVLLADLTIISRPYSLYCFNKFAKLVEQLIPRLTDGFNVCFRHELTRLSSLQNSLVNMFTTLVYDVEDVVEHLQLCTMLHEQSLCVSEIAELYGHLATHLEEKLDVIEKFSLAETNASYDRLQLCAFQTSVTVLFVNLQQLTADIETCREVGPHLLDSTMF